VPAVSTPEKKEPLRSTFARSAMRYGYIAACAAGMAYITVFAGGAAMDRFLKPHKQHFNTVDLECGSPVARSMTFNNVDVYYLHGEAVRMETLTTRNKMQVPSGCNVRPRP
jgi:hypothetical protein